MLRDRTVYNKKNVKPLIFVQIGRANVLCMQRPDILEELQKSQKVFAEKLNHLSRRLAWINATIYSKVEHYTDLHNNHS